MLDRVLDRVPKYDEKSKNFPIRTLVEGKSPRSYSWRHVQLDQGTEGACVGFSAAMEAAARPKPFWGNPILFQYGVKDSWPIHQAAYECYNRAKQIDEWDGENYEGTSVLAGMKAGKERGWWSEYRWALGPGAEAATNDVILSLSYHGPVVMGTWWWSNMFEADSDGYLNPTGYKVGGHAWLLTRYSKKRDAVWTPNSWGGAGQGWVKRQDLVSLLADQGEACIPVLRNIQPK